MSALAILQDPRHTRRYIRARRPRPAYMRPQWLGGDTASIVAYMRLLSRTSAVRSELDN